MKCPECESFVDENANVCNKCGHVFDDDTQEIENLIQDILDEEDQDKLRQKNVSNAKPNNAKPSNPKPNNSKPSNSKPSNSKQNSIKTPSISSSGKKSMSVNEIAIRVTRYTIALFIFLSIIGLLFNWMTLSGRGTMTGFIVDENTDNYLSEASVVQLSGQDLLNLAIKKGDTYKMTTDTLGNEKRSVVSTIHMYYMYAIAIYFLICILALFIILIFKRLSGTGIVRNLAIINLLIIGLNILGMKITYFSAIGIRARQLLKFEFPKATIKYTLEGIAVDNEFYPYTVTIEQGLYLTAAFIVIWLFLSAILNELNNKEELDKIDESEN